MPLMISCSTVSEPEYEFLNTTYSVAGRFTSEESVSAENLKEYDFVYCMAGPSWKVEDFDGSQDEINRIYVENFDYEEVYGNDYMLRYIDNIHKNGGRILCCFPGSEIVEIASIPERRVRFAAMMAQFVKKFDYDGVDIDWEHTIVPSLHVALMKDIRSEMEKLNLGKRLYLTTALHTYIEFSDAEAEELCRYVDWINLMFYDMGGGIWGKVPSHNAPLDVMKQHIGRYWGAFPKDKICIGLASYGFYYKGIMPGEEVDEGKNLGDYGRYCNYTELPAMLDKGWYEKKDTVAECSYFISPDNTEFMTLETEESIDAKLKWIKSAGFDKIFWWEFYCDWKPSGDIGRRGTHLIMDYVSRKTGRLSE